MKMAGKIAVNGASVMGSGIVQICVQAGFRANLMDLNDKIISRGGKGKKGSWNISQQGEDEFGRKRESR